MHEQKESVKKELADLDKVIQGAKTNYDNQKKSLSAL